MPTYTYKCIKCEKTKDINHKRGESLDSLLFDDCEQAECLVERVPSTFQISNKQESEVGNLTKEYIEKNKAVLSKMKKSAELGEL